MLIISLGTKLTKSPLTVRHPLEKRPCPSLYQAYKLESINHTCLQTDTQRSCHFTVNLPSSILHRSLLNWRLMYIKWIRPQVDLAPNRRRPCSSLMANLRRRIRHRVEIPSNVHIHIRLVHSPSICPSISLAH